MSKVMYVVDLSGDSVGISSCRVPLDRECTVEHAMREIEKRLRVQLNEDVEVSALLVGREVLFEIDSLKDVIGTDEVLVARIILNRGGNKSTACGTQAQVVEPSVAAPVVDLVAAVGQRAPAGDFNGPDGAIKIRYRTLDDRASDPAQLMISSSARLIDLKLAFSKILGLSDFFPDKSTAQSKSSITYQVEYKDNSFLLSFNKYLSVKDLKLKIIEHINNENTICEDDKSLEDLGADAVSSFAPQDIHYLVSSPDLCFIGEKDDLSQIFPASESSGSSKILLYGPKFNCVDELTTWRVKFIAEEIDIDSDRNRCPNELSIQLACKGDLIEINNWLLSGFTLETVADLKLKFVKTVLSDYSNDSEDAALQLVKGLAFYAANGDLLQDAASIKASGIQSMSVVRVSHGELNNMFLFHPSKIDVALAAAGIDGPSSHVVPCLSTDLISTLKERARKLAPTVFDASAMRLRFQKTFLRDEDTLGDAGVCAGSEVVALQSPASDVSPGGIEEQSVPTKVENTAAFSSRSVIQLSHEQHMIYSSYEEDQRCLSYFGIGNDSLLYVFHHRSDNMTEELVPDLRGGNLSRFLCTPYWRCTGSSTTAQNDHSMNSFLSALYCFTEYLRNDHSLRYSALKLFGSMSRFPPAVSAMAMLCSGEGITGGEQSLLSQSCLQVMRLMFPKSFTDIDLFKHSRVFFTFLLTQPAFEADIVTAGAENPAPKEMVTFDLTCFVTGNRASDPVRVLHREAEARPADTKISSSEEYVVCSRAEVPKKCSVVLSVDPLFELVFRCHPAREAAHVLDENLIACCKEQSDLEPYSWRALCQRKSPDNSLTQYNPMSLKHNRPPKLTLDSKGDSIVYTGRGKGEGSGLNLFSPVSGETSDDAQTLAKALEKLRVSGSLSEMVDIRKPSEAIVICLDVSNSMDQPVNFPGDTPDEDGYESDDEHWTWKKECDADGVNVTEIGISEINLETPGDDGLVRTDDVVVDVKSMREEIQKEKLQFDAAVRRMTSQPSFSTMKKLAKSHGADTVLREYVRLEDFEYPRSTASFDIISRHYSRFVEILMKDDADRHHEGDAEALPDVEDHIEDLVPKDMLCPISLQLLQDPVVATDGFTYERSSILSWIGKGHLTSPLTGLPLSSDTLVENRVMKSQVSTWLAAASLDIEMVSESKEDGDSPDELVVKIVLRGSTAEGNKSHSLKLFKRNTVKDIKRFCMRLTKGSFFPDRVIFRGMSCKDDSSMSRLSVKNNEVFMLCSKPATETSISVKLILRNREEEYFFIARKSDSGRDLLWRLWKDYDVQPSKSSLFTGLKPSGDGVSYGSVIEYNEQLSQYVKYTSSGELDIIVSNVIRKEKYQHRILSRLMAVKQLFRAFVERTEAYDLPHHIGLVLFGSTASCSCELTPNYDEFKLNVDNASSDGDTAMFDALDMAREKLDSFSIQYPECRKRILCLSDGADNKSAISAYDVTRALQKSNIVCDSFMIGPLNHGKGLFLRSVSKATGGYAFYPDTLKQALHLNELETLLSLADREVKPPIPLHTEYSFSKLSWTENFDCVNDLKRRVEPMLAKPVINLPLALDVFAQVKTEGDIGTRDRSSTKRIISEMRKLMANPHPSIDIYPCLEDIGFWRLVLQAPESTPYSQGCYLLFLRFPLDYPSTAPEVRFVTPIHHCNINSQGKVCHSIFDRNWLPQTTLTTVLNCVFGLLLSPDVSDPLDSHIALSFYDDCGAYEATIIEHTKANASKTRREWSTTFKAEAMDLTQCLQEIKSKTQPIYALFIDRATVDTVEFESNIEMCEDFITYTRRAMSLDSTNAFLARSFSLGTVALSFLLANCENPNFEKIISACDSVLAIDGDNFEALLLRAESYYKKGQLSRAQSDLLLAENVISAAKNSNWRQKCADLRSSLNASIKKEKEIKKTLYNSFFG